MQEFVVPKSMPKTFAIKSFGYENLLEHSLARPVPTGLKVDKAQCSPWDERCLRRFRDQAEL
jgi:hypothetical protein